MKKTKSKKNLVIGLGIVALIALIAAFFIQYLQTGEVVFLLLALGGMVLMAAVLSGIGKKSKSKKSFKK